MTSIAIENSVLQPRQSVELLVATPASEDQSMTGVVDMLLKDHARLNRLLRDEACQRELIPRLLAVAVIGFAIYGVIVTAILGGLNAKTGFWLAHLPAAHWNDLTAANLTIAYTLGLIAANGICLPSFYFYGLLAGIRISMLGVVAHALKGMAAGAVALVGLLPIYVAVALASIVFPTDEMWMTPTVMLGLILPFLAGLAGAANLYEGFVGLADTMCPARAAQRVCFLRRLMLAWCACATFVTPAVIFTLWKYLSDVAVH